MKKLRVLSLIAVFSILLCLCCSSVYATSESDVAVSGTDVVVYESLADYELVKYKVDAHQLSFLVPSFNTSFGATSNNLEIYSLLSGYTLEDIINYNYDYYGSSLSYIYSGYSDDQSISVNCFYFSNKYTEFIGNYDDLSDVDMEAIASTTSLLSSETVSSVVTIGGHTFLYEEYTDTENDTYSICIETIVNGGRYQLFIDLTAPTSADKEAAQKIVNSFRVGGLAPSNLGFASSGLTTALLVIVCVLLVIVLLLAFFIVRFSLYSRAAGGSFNIIGFSLPPIELVKASFASSNESEESDEEEEEDADEPLDID